MSDAAKRQESPLRIAYADPPYPGQAKRHYGTHPDYAGEVDHAALLGDLASFDGWMLSTSAAALPYVLSLCPTDSRVAVWHRLDSPNPGRLGTWWWKWEAVIIHGARPPKETTPDLFSAPQLKTARITGEKPYEFCAWIFRLAGLRPTDELFDLFPGSGAVTEAWNRWKTQPELPQARARNLRPCERVLRLRHSQLALEEVDPHA